MPVPRRIFLLSAAANASEPAPDTSIVFSSRTPVLDETRAVAVAKSRRIGAVDVDLSSLRATREHDGGSSTQFVVGRETTLELFEGEPHRFKGVRVEDGLGGVSTWVGRLVGEANDGEVTLSASGERLHATVQVGLDRYIVESAGPGTGWVREVDPTKEGRCLTDDIAPERESTATKRWPAPSPAPKSMSTSTIDLLILYTEAVAYAYGEPWIPVANLVTNMNSGFNVAGIDAAVRVVHYEQSSAADPETLTEFSTTLGAMQTGASPHFSGLHDLRDDHGADVVILLSMTGGGQAACGAALGTIFSDDLSNPTATANNKAFAAVAIDCAVSDHTFTHEIGHLLGGRHDHTFYGGDCGIDNQSCGHTNIDAPLRTIMGSVNSGGFTCSMAGCTRINRFSNYNKFYTVDSVPYRLGREYDPMDSNDANELTFASTVSFVADYRSPPGSAPGTPGSFSVGTCYGAHIMSWSTASGVPGWYEVQTDSSPSFTSPPMLIYWGSQNGVIYEHWSPFYARVRACNGTGCSSWSASGLNDPAYCD